jgi:hypothetical protein
MALCKDLADRRDAPISPGTAALCRQGLVTLAAWSPSSSASDFRCNEAPWAPYPTQTAANGRLLPAIDAPVSDQSTTFGGSNGFTS